MAKSSPLELAIKIGGKVDKSLIAAINSAQRNVSGLSTTLSKVGTAGLAAMGALATGPVTALAKCTDAAKDFETQMSDVVKYVDGLADASGKVSSEAWGVNAKGEIITYADNYARMSEAILDLSTEIPYTAEELTRLAAAAGQSGKTMSDLIDGGFLKDVAMIGTAWDISADQAGDWAAKWEVAFDKSHEEIMELADQINYLGAHNATTAAEIAEVVNEAAGLGQVAGMDVDATAALGTAMLAMGVDTAKAANSINRMYTNMSKGESATKAQKEMWQELGFTASEIAASMQSDASGTLLKVFEQIQQLPDERQVAALSTLFGQWAITGAAKLTGNLDTFKQALRDIDNNALFDGSMNREFVIKSETSEALDTRMKSAFSAFQIDIGNAFLPAKKEISLALIDLLNTVRDMPELTRVAEMLASLFSTGLEKAGDALESAMPVIKNVLEYLADHGPEVISVLGKMAAAFAAMKFAPGIEGIARGAGGLLFGSETGGATHTGSGGFAGVLGSLWKGGQSAAGNAKNAVTATLPNLIQSAGGILGTARTDAKLSGRSLPSVLLSGAGTLFGQTGIGQYLGGVKSSLGNFFNVSGLSGMAGVGKEILSGISNETGLTGLVNGGAGLAKSIPGRAAGLASTVVNSAPVQAIGGFAGRIAGSAPAQGIASIASGAAGWLGNAVPAGAGALGSIWGPVLSGFGGLLSGALPIVGAVSGIIAVVSILTDRLGGMNAIVKKLFGTEGFANFVKFKAKLTMLFQDGGVAQAMAPLREAVTGIFGDNAGAAFDGLVSIIQSVMGVVGQLVTFANTTVKPIIESIFNFITTMVVPIILQAFTAAAPIISGILSNLGTAIMTVAQIIGTAIQAALPIVGGLITAFLTIGQVVLPAVLGGIEAFTAGLVPIIVGIQTALQGVIDFITGVFTGNWEQAWNGVRDIFGGIFEALVGLVKTPINAVIGIINGAISGINSISFTMPDWSPIMPGEKIGFDLPTIPMLAKGGFTTGPSIAGEAGTEAVISFQRSARSSNIATWAKAGQMLGVGSNPARLETFDGWDGGPDWPNGNGGGAASITYAPTIIVQGNASKEDIDAALRDDKARFKAWYEEMKRNERRVRY